MPTRRQTPISENVLKDGQSPTLDRSVRYESTDIGPDSLRRVTQAPGTIRPETVLQLQRLVGNRAVGQMVGHRPNRTGMPEEAKDRMETALGTDLSDVKIHPNSSEPRKVGALAFTQGRDVHFAPGHYAPHTTAGQRLLGHELTHVTQQRAGKVQATGSIGKVRANLDPALEREANLLGDYAARLPAGSPAGKQVEPIRRIEVKGPLGASAASAGSGGVVQCRLAPGKVLKKLLYDEVMTLDQVRSMVKRTMMRMMWTVWGKDPKDEEEFVEELLDRVFVREEKFDPSEYIRDHERFNPDEYERVVKLFGDKVYRRRRRPEEPIKNEKLKKKLEETSKKAAQRAKQSATKKKWLLQVFGPKKEHVSYAVRTYTKVAERLGQGLVYTTDFNKDYEQTRIEGFSVAGSGRIFLTPEKLMGNKSELVLTLIHETSHEVDSNIDDHSYYGDSEFRHLPGELKVRNADHYIEVPKRITGSSDYQNMAFRERPAPREVQSSQLTGQETETIIENSFGKARSKLLKAWQMAGNVHMKLREIAVNPPTLWFPEFSVRRQYFLVLNKASKNMGLSFHQQMPGRKRLTQLDLALSESNVQGFVKMAELQNLPNTDSFKKRARKDLRQAIRRGKTDPAQLADLVIYKHVAQEAKKFTKSFHKLYRYYRTKENLDVLDDIQEQLVQ